MQQVYKRFSKGEKRRSEELSKVLMGFALIAQSLLEMRTTNNGIFSMVVRYRVEDCSMPIKR